MKSMDALRGSCQATHITVWRMETSIMFDKGGLIVAPLPLNVNYYLLNSTFRVFAPYNSDNAKIKIL